MAIDSTSGSRGQAKPSSSRSERLFGGIYARGEVAACVSDEAWLQAMLDVEAALARASAPAREAAEIAAACRAEFFDLDALAVGTAENASPVVPLVKALRDAVGPDLAAYVHAGATSQDIVDTALMLVARRSCEPLVTVAGRASDAAAALADAHRSTPMFGRTLLQQAVPTSFGLKAAGWMTALDQAAAGVASVELAVQMGGPVGSQSPAVASTVASCLGLGEPVLPWHTDRRRVVQLASALGVLAGACGKVALDVALLSQNEVGEVRERTSGGSSSMPHKRNPVAAVSARACATRVPGLVATMHSAMAEQEHERAAGAWQAEWGTMSDLLALTGSAVAWTAEMLAGLEVDPERMRANLGSTEVDLGAADELIDRALAAHNG
jgi:3-carboxy-cis,cis-muconate cycloisomerase